jgi:hypothetical protein
MDDGGWSAGGSWMRSSPLVARLPCEVILELHVTPIWTWFHVLLLGFCLVFWLRYDCICEKCLKCFAHAIKRKYNVYSSVYFRSSSFCLRYRCCNYSSRKQFARFYVMIVFRKSYKIYWLRFVRESHIKCNAHAMKRENNLYSFVYYRFSSFCPHYRCCNH